ncbi:hypothetical protein EYS14_23175 [Alteromonadaceae bacterium M269]|nr:hypothetical protein EYS14_23175 [Alteromonadaceae bacterium M269]
MSTVIKKYFLQSLTFAFIAALLFTPFDALANKVKIKRDFIYIDKKKTPLKVEKDDTDTYIFTDTSSGKVFVTASYLFERVDDENSFQWLVLKTDGSSYANEVDLEYISFTLSVKKAVTEFLMKRLGFFDAKGVVNQSKLDEYFSQQRVRASQQKQIAAAADLAEQEAQFQKTASLGITVDADAKKYSENLMRALSYLKV